MSIIELKKPDMSGKFVVGSTVKLNGGSAIMTVRKSTRASVNVDWHNANNDPINADYHPDMLFHIDPDEKTAKDE